MPKKSILLIYRNQNLSTLFEKELKENDFEVEVLFKKPIPYFTLTFLQKIFNIIYRNILKNNSYPQKANEINFNRYCRKSIHAIPNKKYDYCLVIRGDLVPEFAIKKARKLAVKMVDFQLDGISVSKKILEYKNYFDDIFVFDKEDQKNYLECDFKFITNCYFGEINPPQINKYDFLYIGMYLKERNISLKNLLSYLEGNNIIFNSYIYLLVYKKMENLHSKINQNNQALNYSETLDFVKESNLLLDFKRDEHTGLSLRFFEAMQYQKKIITNNFSVKDYDFYHPNNIFVTDYQNFDGLEDFIKLPYIRPNKEIEYKYSFKNWINQILDIK